MSSPFDKQTVYHSALVANSPVEMKMLSDKPEEKFKHLQMAFVCGGDTHYYRIENEDCGKALSGYKGQTITINASGREDEATIEVETSENRGRAPQREERREEPKPERRQEAQRQQPPALTEEDRAHFFKAAKVYGARCSVLMRVAMKFANEILRAELGDEYNSEDIRAMAATLFIEMRGHLDISKLPSTWIDTKKAPEPKPEPRLEEPPQRKPPAPDPDLDAAAEDDIPF